MQRTTPANNIFLHIRLDPLDTTTTFFCMNVLELVYGFDLREHCLRPKFFWGKLLGISIDFIDGLTFLNMVRGFDRVAVHFVFALALFCTINSRIIVQKLRSMHA